MTASEKGQQSKSPQHRSPHRLPPPSVLSHSSSSPSHRHSQRRIKPCTKATTPVCMFGAFSDHLLTSDALADFLNAQPAACAPMHHPPPPAASTEPKRQERKKKVNHCRFFASKSGCRVGDKCPYVHDVTQLPQPSVIKEKEEGSVNDPIPTQDDSERDGLIRDRTQVISSVPPSRVVTKPVPKAQLEDPRDFQLAQIRRRYSPKETTDAGQSGKGTTILRLKLAPSDPDFPFEMSALDCSLSIPPDYPKEAPKLSVKNSDIPRGFALNIERGFDGLIQRDSPGTSTLLGLMKELDKNLEIFLSEKKVDTVKIVTHTGPDMRHLQNLPVRAVVGPEKPTKIVQPTPPISKPSERPAPAKVYTAAQKGEAKQRRDVETRQLEARLGRLPLFKKSGDGIAFTVPLDPRKKQELPLNLQAVKSTKLFVPLLYPLEPCRIKLDGVYGDEARAVENAFAARAKKESSLTLMGHVNYLTINMYMFAEIVPEPESAAIVAPVVEPAEETPELLTTQGAQAGDYDDSHIKRIPRPPEWDIIHDSDAEDSSDDFSYDSGDEDEASDAGGVEVADTPNYAAASTPNNERGTSLSFPFMELYGMELLELTTLNLTVKCERCKDAMDITGLQDGKAKTESCKKCASNLLVCFRKELLHANAIRAGFLDLEGCIVLDMLPSTFEPTCSQCSTAFTTGVISVRGEITSNICRECHQKFSFKLPEVKFLRITYSSHLPSAAPRRKKETLGLVAGQELPKRGRCRHYAKSYRWFRFSCCNKVYACDRCHDEVEEHPNEHANRMICGFCSREGNYRPEDCGVCHSVLIGKKGSGFWEGGKGTRDRTRMSRKDKRKYRRIGGKKT